MKREECIEILRVGSVFMMFLMTIFSILLCYFAATHGGLAPINMRGPERDMEVFIVFPVIVALCIFTLSIEAYKLAEKQGLITAIILLIIAMVGMFLFMFASIFWRG